MKDLSTGSGQTSYAYDPSGRLDLKTVLNGIRSLPINYDHDANGNVTRTTTGTDPDVRYQWDALNRLTNVVDEPLAGRKNTTYSYDEAGNLLGYEYPNLVRSEYAYDEWNRLTALNIQKGNDPALANFGYALLKRGNRQTLTENLNGTARTVNYEYDSLDRLTKELISGVLPAGATPAGSVTYDSA